MGKQWKRLRKVCTGHGRGDLMDTTQSSLLGDLLRRSSPRVYLSAVWKPRELISAQRVGGMLQQQREKFFLCCEIGWHACSCPKMLRRKNGRIQIRAPGGVHLSGLLSRCISWKPHRLWPLLSWRLSIACPPVSILSPCLSNTEFLCDTGALFSTLLSPFPLSSDLS